MTLLETYCGLLRSAALEEASQHVDKLNIRAPHVVAGERGQSSGCQTYDMRASNQDATSVSDGESVGPIDSPDSIEPEVADLVCAAVQEMESLARNCILVEESYQRYFMRNCGTQKEEAVWRQQGIREEAMTRQAAKAISHIHISELWARVGYYNNEAAQRSNLFRLLLQEKRKLEGDGQLPDPRNRGLNKGTNGSVRQTEKRRKRPNQSSLDGMVHGHAAFELMRAAAAKAKSDEPTGVQSSTAPPCRTALVHNPYSFDGPSHVTVAAGHEEDTTSPPAVQPATSDAARCVIPSAPTIGAMGAVFKRALPEQWQQAQESAKGLTFVVNIPKTGPDHGTPLAASSPTAVRGIHPSKEPVNCHVKVVRSVELTAMDQKSSTEETESTGTDADSTFVNTEMHRDGKRPPMDGKGGVSPLVNGAVAEANIPYPPVVSEVCPPIEPLSQTLASVVDQLTEQGSVSSEPSGRRARKKTSKPDEDANEDHATLLTYPTCNHVKYWKRLRANRGFAYFVCYYCGAKWRMFSKGSRTPNTANAGGRSQADTPMPSVSVGLDLPDQIQPN